MLTVICSTEQIESMEYYLRSSGVADVFLRKNIQKQETEDGGAGKGTPYTADEVYFAVTGEKASKESIAEDFDYWYNKGEEITQGELADKYSLEELRMQAYSNASEACLRAKSRYRSVYDVKAIYAENAVLQSSI